MRKLFIQEMISADGFFAGANGDISWHNVGDAEGEFNAFAAAMLESVDTLIFGGTTYELMNGWWPKPERLKDDPVIAAKMNGLAKVVFSKTLKDSAPTLWNNTKVMREIDADAIRKMKAAEGKDIVILGSGTIVKQFAELGLIDEYRLIINPVVLGAGKTLFEGLKAPQKLTLTKTHEFKSGSVLVVYEPV